MKLIGARQDAPAEGLDLQPGITSYFIGRDPRKWRAGVPHYAKVRYRDIYPGIDLVYYGNRAGRLEYDFVVSPGADPALIQMAYNRPVHRDAGGDLRVAGVTQKRPRVWQGAREIACSYQTTSSGGVSIHLAEYDHRRELVIDPVLEYSTYLGGPGFEVGTGIQVDGQGNMYISMLEQTPTNPALSPFQQPNPSSYAAFVVKFAPDGQSIVYYAYVGGSGNTYANSIAVDSSGNSYMTGQTETPDLPVINAAQPEFGGGYDDAFAVKISSDGKSILYCTYLGGSRSDLGNAIAVDGSGRAYIVGFTNSTQDFPILNALQPQSSGADGFLTRLSADGRSFDFSTFYGGTGISNINGLALDSAGNIYITGGAGAADFPVKNPFQSGVASGFVAKFAPDAGSVVYSSFLGDQVTNGWSIAVDASGAAFVSGAAGPQFPTKNAFQASYGGGEDDLFLAKVSPDGSALEFATFLGGSALDYQNQNALALDTSGNVYITGWTYSADFPLQSSLESSTAGPQAPDAIVAEFSSTGALVYSTVFGGPGDNRGGAITVDGAGAVYVTGSTSAQDFPLKNPFQSTYGGSTDAIIFKLAPAVVVTPALVVSPSALQFSYVLGSSVPQAKTVSVTSNPPGVTFTPSSSASWLAVSGAVQTTPATLSVSIDPTGLSAGPNSGVIQLDSHTSVQVSLMVQNSAPTLTSLSPSSVPVGSPSTAITISGSGFLSGASVVLNNQALTSGVTVVDSNTIQVLVNQSAFAVAGEFTVTVLNPFSAASNSLTIEVGTPAPQVTAVTNAATFRTGSVSPGEIITIFGTNLVGTVTFDGAAATMIYASPRQVNVTVPYSVAEPATTLQMGTQSVPLVVTPASPGIFAGVLAAPGIVTLYATGGGTLSADPLPRIQLPVSVTVNGEAGQVLYSGIAPNLVQGANQVNLMLPADAQTGTVSIILTIGGVSAPAYQLTLP